jgi:D-alanyl-lipoteichoic acid acyltransferase DltB (MBOAT superfamily)
MGNEPVLSPRSTRAQWSSPHTSGIASVDVAVQEDFAAAVAPPFPEVVRPVPARVKWRELGELAPVLLQLSLAALVIRRFELENRSFFQVFLLAAIAFPINALLTLRYRLPFFAALSLGTIGLVFGAHNGAMLVAVGVVLIGVCHLPIRLNWRVAILVGLGAALALSRDGRISSVLAPEVWPILGSMFMFRLALYLHGLRHDPAPPSVARTLAYFFMVPNVCYPLYPVVDYTTFGRTHFDREASEIYERGMKWIARGLFQLILYRFVYLHVTLDVTQIKSLGDVVQAVLGTFFLYLRVSGQFHLIVGMLHLFGFNLPETHRLYFLASSISDFWRRINIYWKDFMMKLVFYPSFFRIRKRSSDRTALVVATMLVFLATWLLHSYQWFWLRSEFPITPQDIIFWGLLGGLVVVNTLWESTRGRKRSLGAARKGWRAPLALRTTGTFILLCVLWSLWSADSLVDWVWMWTRATHIERGDVLVLLALLVVALAITGVVWDARIAVRTEPAPFYKRPAVQTTGLLVSLLLFTVPSLQQQAGPRLAGVVRSLQSAALNKGDRALQQKGYYEKLDNNGRLSMQLWNVEVSRPPGMRPLSETRSYRLRQDDFLGYDLAPLTQAVVIGKTMTVNRWGMRDKDYALEKPVDTRRIAMTGPSFTMGTGVSDDSTYDALLERELNESSSTSPHFEVLNFGVAAYSLLQQVRTLDEKGYRFQPDIVVLADGRNPEGPIVQNLSRALSNRTTGVYPGLDSIIARAGVRDVGKPGIPVPTEQLRRVARAMGIKVRMPWREVDLRLYTVAGDIIDWSFRHVAQEARAHGAIPVFVDGAMPSDTSVADTPMTRSARAAGVVVIKLSSIWQGQPLPELEIGSWDLHPNGRGMHLIARGLYREFDRKPELNQALGH